MLAVIFSFFVFVAGQRGVSFALEASSESMSSGAAITFSDISDRLGPFVNGPTNVNNGGEVATAISSGLQGMVFFDYDNDDDLDLFVCSQSPVTATLFENAGDGTYTDVTDSVGLSGITDCQGVTVGDLNNDGFVDIFLTGDLAKSGTFLFKNIDGTRFEDVTASSGIVSLPFNYGNSMADYDADGFLDLYMAYGRFGPDRLYRNNGDMTWSDVTEEAGLLTEGNLGDDGAGNTCGVAFADLNGDGYPELITSNCSSSEGRPATINFNNGDGTFEEAVALPAAMPVGFFMGIAIGDVDHDGDFDIFLTDVGAQTFEPSYLHSLLLNNGDGTFVDATPEDLPQNEWGWSASFEDFDNNGSVDLLYTGSGIFTAFVNFNRGHLLMNDGAGLLAEDSTCPPFDCTTCTANNILGNQPDLCYTPELCQLRDASTGTWTGAAEFCNEIAVGCDECYRSRSTCAFVVEEEPACVRSLGVDLATSRSGGHAVGDIDGDGFDEIAIMNSNYAEDYSYFFNQTDYVMPGAINHVVLLKNSGNDNNSIRLRLVGTKSNRNGIGSLLTCDDGSNKMQYLQVRAVSGPFSPTQFFPSFGIGKMNSATIAIQWPSGLNEKFVDVQANELITLEEGTGSVMEGDGGMSSENDAIYPESGDESSAPDDSAPTDTSDASFLLPPEFFYGAPLSFIFFAFY